MASLIVPSSTSPEAARLSSAGASSPHAASSARAGQGKEQALVGHRTPALQRGEEVAAVARASAPSHSSAPDRKAEPREAGDAVVGDPARHDAGEMREVRVEIDREAVHRHPACARARRSRRSWLRRRRCRGSRCRSGSGTAQASTPKSPSVAITQPSSAWTKRRTSRPRAIEVEQHVADPLARARDRYSARRARSRPPRSARSSSSCRRRAGPGGVDRRMLEQPDQLARLARGDRGVARLLLGQRGAIGHRRGRCGAIRSPLPARGYPSPAFAGGSNSGLSRAGRIARGGTRHEIRHERGLARGHGDDVAPTARCC